jgi:hypothetical protein
MPYYTYESLNNPGERFEFKQSINDEPFTRHPETDEPIKRIIVPGAAICLPGLKRSTVVNKLSPAATACGCASNAALAQAMYANSRTTPRYGERSGKLSVSGAGHVGQHAGHSHSHSHGGHRCSGHKH